MTQSVKDNALCGTFRWDLYHITCMQYTFLSADGHLKLTGNKLHDLCMNMMMFL